MNLSNSLTIFCKVLLNLNYSNPTDADIETCDHMCCCMDVDTNADVESMLYFELYSFCWTNKLEFMNVLTIFIQYIKMLPINNK